MAATRWQTLVLLAVALALATWYGLHQLVRHGGMVPEVGALVLPVELVIAGVVLAMGWAVRQFLSGHRPLLDPVRAARTAVLAKASCYTGALLLGWYGGQSLALVTDPGVPGNGTRALVAGAAAGGALVIAVVGLVVERFCRVPPPSDDTKERAPSAEPGPAAG